MAALTERFQGLRRPGASLLKKGLPSRPDEPVITRKAVPPPKVTVEQPVVAPPPQKGLPPAPVSPPPSSTLPPTPSAASEVSSPASAATTVTPSTAQSQPQSSRPPRSTSLKKSQPAAAEQRPQHRLVAHLQVNNNSPQQRPISEAPSISQFIPDPEPEPDFDAAELTVTANDFARGGGGSSGGGGGGGGGGRSETSENSSDQQTPSSSTHSNGSGISSSIFKNYPDGYVPSIPETIVIPPLTPVHYACFQSHANMPAASNMWYATACMTCKKVDQEVRHRCTFCCMRICAPCFERLQKCKGRGLRELMSTL
ncbi:hypothetical protein UA08_07825 [Talaromyces atroroseus]|uniref:Uncharacterized protein n=1 Tax=Talaromyces atroroseus TaxID=1441469 RepID=A0A225APS6_TALAT|nr:hypothetical protein UA08_07825 [Talaromyces atroroseus]OKL56956.1 hypothetical protein UA08_07825 [Talaromyces atroroseus]